MGPLEGARLGRGLLLLAEDLGLQGGEGQVRVVHLQSRERESRVVVGPRYAQGWKGRGGEGTGRVRRGANKGAVRGSYLRGEGAGAREGLRIIWRAEWAEDAITRIADGLIEDTARAQPDLPCALAAIGMGTTAKRLEDL